MDKELREYLLSQATPGTRIEVSDGQSIEYFDGRPLDDKKKRIGEIFRVIGLPKVHTIEEARAILESR